MPKSKRCSSVEVAGWNDIIGGEYMDELIAISTGFRNFSRSLSDCSKYLLLHSSDRAVIHRAESLGSYNWLTSDVDISILYSYMRLHSLLYFLSPTAAYPHDKLLRGSHCSN